MTAGDLFWAAGIRATPPMYWGTFGRQQAHKGKCVKRNRVGLVLPVAVRWPCFLGQVRLLAEME
jgi:hypothetical protein